MGFGVIRWEVPHYNVSVLVAIWLTPRLCRSLCRRTRPTGTCAPCRTCECNRAFAIQAEGGCAIRTGVLQYAKASHAEGLFAKYVFH